MVTKCSSEMFQIRLVFYVLIKLPFFPEKITEIENVYEPKKEDSTLEEY